jgi:hypothetical protein
MFYWYFKRAGTSEQDQSWYYFRAVEPDFTPMPVYHSMREYITTQTPTLYAGVHAPTHWAIQRGEGIGIEPLEGATFGDALTIPPGRDIAFGAQGTDLTIRWRGMGGIIVTVNGQPHELYAAGADWEVHTIPLRSSDERVNVRVGVGTGLRAAEIDSITVVDRTSEIGSPLVFVAAALVTAVLVPFVAVMMRRKP